MHYKKKPAVARFKNVQCVPRMLVDGRINTHYYHRPTRTRLPAPESPEFKPAWEKAERQLAARRPKESAKDCPPSQQNSESNSRASASKFATSDQTQSRGEVVRPLSSTDGLPFYADEHGITVAP